MFKSRQNHLNRGSMVWVAMCLSLVGCDMLFPVTSGPHPAPPTSPPPASCSPAKLTLSCDPGTFALGGEADVKDLATNRKGTQSIRANASNGDVCSAMVSAASQAGASYQKTSLTSVQFCGDVSVTVCGAQFSCSPPSSCTSGIISGSNTCDNWPP
jgi:hypothetical protein